MHLSSLPVLATGALGAVFGDIGTMRRPNYAYGDSYFLIRQTLIASSKPGMAIWREKLFAWMIRNAESPMEYLSRLQTVSCSLGRRLKLVEARRRSTIARSKQWALVR